MTIMFRAVIFFLLLLSVPLVAKQKDDSLRQVLSEHPNEDTTRVVILNKLALELRFRNVSQALHYSLEALDIANKIGYQNGIITALSLAGVMYRNRGDYPSALEYYNKSFLLAQQAHNTEQLIYAFSNLGNLYYLLGEYNKALDYLLQGKRMADSVHSDDQLAYCYVNIGRVYSALNKPKEAIEFASIALSIRERQHNIYGIINALNTIANIHFANKNYDVALAFYKQSLVWGDSLKGEGTLRTAEFGMGQIYFEQKNFPAAEKYLSLAIEHSEEYAIDMLGALKTLSSVFAGQKKYEEAYHTQIKYGTLKDSLFSDEKRNSIFLLEKKAETEKHAIETKAQSDMNRALLVGLALVIILLFVAVNRYRLKQKANEEILRQQKALETQARFIQEANTELSEKNLELSDANQKLQLLNVEKNELLGIVAHDLKNPISTIQMTATILEEDCEELPPDLLRQFSAGIRSSARRMTDLITNLLDVNAIEQGKISVVAGDFNVQNVIRAVYEEASITAISKNITLNTDIPDEAIFASADGAKTLQVLENLISNSIKYSYPGKQVWLRVRTVGSEKNWDKTDTFSHKST